MISGLRLAREIGNASALDEWRGAEVGPGSGVTDDDGLRGYGLRDRGTRRRSDPERVTGTWSGTRDQGLVRDA
jgi:hypothetical protein